jgi:hypothetical protein
MDESELGERKKSFMPRFYARCHLMFGFEMFDPIESRPSSSSVLGPNSKSSHFYSAEILPS